MLKYVAALTLANTLSYALIGFISAFLMVTILGSGPHGYGDFAYITFPILFAPVGLVVGLIVGLVKKPGDLGAVLRLTRNASAIFFAILAVLTLAFFIFVKVAG